MPPERTAEYAHARIDGHENLDEERFAQLRVSLGDLETTVDKGFTRLEANQLTRDSIIHERISKLGDRMFQLMVALCGMSVVALASIVAWRIFGKGFS